MQPIKAVGKKLISAVTVFVILLAIGTSTRAQSGKSRQSRVSVTVSPASVNFGNVNVGATSGRVTIALSNSSRESITISNVSLSLLQVTYSGPAIPATIEAGQTVQATLQFAPNAAKAYSGTLEFAESTGRTVSAQISGTGIAVSAPAPMPAPSPAPAQLTLGSSTLSFGSVTVGTTDTQTVSVSNTGGSSLTVSGVSVSGAGFNASGVSSGLILTPGQSSTLTVTFDPSATGNAAGTVTIATNVSNGTITVSGSGAAAPVSYSALLSWGLDSSATVGYNVYSSTVSGGPYAKVTSSPVTPTSYTDSTVQSGQTYYYVVTAVGSNDAESGYSNQVSAQIP